MIGAIKAVSTQRGRDPREFVLVAFGGSGPVHAASMARMLEIRRIIVPPAPGLFSAFGLLLADHEHHSVRTFFRTFEDLSLPELREQVQGMEEDALAELAAEGYPPERVRLVRSADLRYVGQGFELLVPVDGGEPAPETLERLEAAFNAEHERIYGHRSDGVPVQFVNLRLTALGLREAREPRVAWQPAGGFAGSPPGDARSPAAGEQMVARRASFGEVGVLETPVLRRAALRDGPRDGPLIVEEYDATTVVPPGCLAWLDQGGNIVLEIESAGDR
jgi:N-methylhydantoinase A